MSSRLVSISKDLNVALHLSYFHEKYVVVSVDKQPKNIFFCV